jgi:hypothetical protein
MGRICLKGITKYDNEENQPVFKFCRPKPLNPCIQELNTKQTLFAI